MLQLYILRFNCVLMLWTGLGTKASGLGLENILFWLQTVADSGCWRDGGGVEKKGHQLYVL